MHRLMIGVNKKCIVDHIDRNGLNNQRVNLREATPLISTINREFNKNSTGYKGVYYSGNKYRARIGVGYKLIELGSFNDIISAAKAYNLAAIKHHGKIAVLNVIPA